MNGYAYRRSTDDYLSLFYDNLPQKAYCSRNKMVGYLLPKDRAILRPYIQVNHPLKVVFIAFDMDYEGSAFAWDERDLPPFTYTVINHANAHTHGMYMIESLFVQHASKSQLRLLKAVISTYSKLLHADKVITSQRQLVKNPFCRNWGLIATGRTYILTELMDSVPRFCRKPIQRDKKADASRGCIIVPHSRNVTLFNEGRFFAYEKVSGCKRSNELFERVLNHILYLNETKIRDYFYIPLPYGEARTITKSITRWVWKKRRAFISKRWNTGAMGFERMKNLSYVDYVKETRQRQSASGKRTSRMRREKTLNTLKSSYTGLIRKYRKVTQKMVAEHTGLSIRTVKYYWHEIIEGAKRSNQDNSLSNIHDRGMGYRVAMLGREKACKPQRIEQGGILHWLSGGLPETREGSDGVWEEVRDIKEGIEPWSMKGYVSGARGK